MPDDNYPRSYTCNHWHPHTIVINDLTDAWADFILRQRGWYEYGWCLESAPKWLLKSVYEEAAEITGLYKYFDKVANHG